MFTLTSVMNSSVSSGKLTSTPPLPPCLLARRSPYVNWILQKNINEIARSDYHGDFMAKETTMTKNAAFVLPSDVFLMVNS